MSTTTYEVYKCGWGRVPVYEAIKRIENGKKGCIDCPKPDCGLKVNYDGSSNPFYGALAEGTMKFEEKDPDPQFLSVTGDCAISSVENRVRQT